TEATMSAIRVARGFTGRDIILKFEGNYHGHGDSLLMKAGSGVATLVLPDSPDVLSSVAKNTITVPYNDVESVNQAFEQYGDQIVALTGEPDTNNLSVVRPVFGFLQDLRENTLKYNALHIFAEVMTGFRVR